MARIQYGPLRVGRLKSRADPGMLAGGAVDMDIVAHGLCTAAAAILVRQRLRRPVRLGWAVLFGVAPDIVSFTVPAVLRIWWRLTGVTASLLPQPGGPRLDWVWGLYACVHSLLIFGLAFALVWAIARRPVWEMLGWLLHLVIDIPTHRGWFAIRFLWPVSAVRFDGIPWETGWLLAATYASLGVVGWWLWRTRGRFADQGLRGVRPE